MHIRSTSGLIAMFALAVLGSGLQGQSTAQPRTKPTTASLQAQVDALRVGQEKLQKDLAGVEGTLPEIALRFCLTAPAVSTVIPGMRRVATVESSCGVSAKGPLPTDVMAILRKHAWNKNYYD